MSTNKSMERIIYPRLSYKVVGVLFDVHRKLGNRLQEKYYQRAIALGFKKANIPFKEQALVQLEYESEPIGRYFVDFVISNKIALDIKAVPKTSKHDYDQMLAYLHVLKLKLGVIANFRAQNLTFKRLVNSRI